MRQIYPVEGQELQIAQAPMAGPLPPAVAEIARLYGNEAVPHPDARQVRLPWLRANMVASTDGAASIGGRSGGLSGPADRMIFTILRSLADLILVGAGTARTERYRPAHTAGLWAQLRQDEAPPPAIAVVTASLKLDPDAPLLTGAAAGARTIVITVADAPPDRKAALARHARIIEAGEHQVDVALAIGELRRLGYAHILCEGGPMLLGQLADAGLVDDLCLTISPVLAAGPAGRIVTSSAPATAAVTAELSLAHVLADESYLLTRYLRPPLT